MPIANYHGLSKVQLWEGARDERLDPDLPWNHMIYAGLDLMLPWGYVEGYPVVANCSMAYTMRSGYKLSIPLFCMRQY